MGRPNRHEIGPGAILPPGPFSLRTTNPELKMTAKRNRRKQTQPLQQRLMSFAENARDRAYRMPPGKEREMLLRRAKQNEVTSDLTDWLSAPGYRRRGE